MVVGLLIGTIVLGRAPGQISWIEYQDQGLVWAVARVRGDLVKVDDRGAYVHEYGSTSAKAYLTASEMESLAGCVPMAPAVWPPHAALINVAAAYESSDLGNARRLVFNHGDDLRYVPEWSKWLTWDARRWQLDVTGEVNRRTKTETETILDEARATNNTKLFAWAIRSQSNVGLNATVAVATTEPSIPVLVSELDTDPWLLTAANGTLDLHTGQLRMHRRADLITKISEVLWDPEAACPTWDRFLEQIIPDDDTREFMQRAAGYSLTGTVTEHVLFMLHGGGANGKSTFLETLLQVLGEHAAPASPRLLVADKHSEHPTAVADLHGRRLVVSQEVEQGLDEPLVKQLTGGDQIKARRMREDYWSFTPTHKLWLACNHKPRIKGNDIGIWRRIRLIPFEVTIAPEQQDHDLGAKLTAELPGILRWAVNGCLAWQRDGLNPPAAVVNATDKYQLESDLISQYLDERSVAGPQYQVRTTVLYTDYKAWCQDNGLDHPLSQKALAKQLDERGLDRTENRAGQSVWISVGLLDNRGPIETQHPGAERL